MLAYDADASVNSGMSLASSRASLALTNSTLGSTATNFSPMSSAGQQTFLFSHRLGHNQVPGGIVAGASSSLLSFRMPLTSSSAQPAQGSLDSEIYGSCFVDDAACEQLWVASCIDESVSPQRRPGNGHVKNF